MTMFRRPSKLKRVKVWTAAGRARWRRSLDWWERLEIDAQAQKVTRRRRFWSRVAVSILSTGLSIFAVAAAAVLFTLGGLLAATIGWFPVLFLNTRHLVRVIWHDHWRD